MSQIIEIAKFRCTSASLRFLLALHFLRSYCSFFFISPSLSLRCLFFSLPLFWLPHSLFLLFHSCPISLNWCRSALFCFVRSNSFASPKHNHMQVQENPEKATGLQRKYNTIQIIDEKVNWKPTTMEIGSQITFVNEWYTKSHKATMKFCLIKKRECFKVPRHRRRKAMTWQ